MNYIIETLQNIIVEYPQRLKLIGEKEYSFKPLPNKWSKKEILGHLVDSVQSNIRRFVIAQYEEAPLIAYNQDNWVSISNYQNYPTKDLIELWTLLNKHICMVLSNTSPEAAQRKVGTKGPELHSIAWFAEDYNKHLLHHLHQILDLPPVAYP